MPDDGSTRYRVLLRLFPRRFREAHEAELRRMYRDMRAEWEGGEGRSGLRLWAGLAWDAVRCAASEWLSLSGYTIRSLATITVGELMFALLADIRYAIRQLIHRPSYAGMVVVLMALAIAGNAAVFRVFNGLFLKPLPFEEAGRLVDLDETAPSWDLEFLSVAFRDFASWRDENRSFEAMAAYDSGGGNLVSDGEPTRVSYLLATHDIDEVLRIEPLLGRFFGPEEDAPDGPRAAVLSEGFWKQTFGGDPGVLGRTLSVNGISVEVVGVLPPEARFFGDFDMWLPLRADRDRFTGWSLSAVGRLLPGVTVDQARDDLMAIHKGKIAELPENEISSPVIHSLRDRYLGDYRLGAGFLLMAVATVLLIACANIAGLMTVRALSRETEIAVRRALGAGRGVIVRQLLTESVVLATVGAGLGVALGVWGSGILIGPLSEQFPRWIRFDLDGRFLAFTVLVTAGAALLFGLSPALRASGSSDGATRSRATADRSRKRVVGGLVTAEVALALALLVVGGLSLVDVVRLGNADPGFDADGLVSYSVSLPVQRYPDDPAQLAFTDRYLEALSGIPGVVSVAAATSVPLGDHWGWFFRAEGELPRAEDEANPVVLYRAVTPAYFETVGVRLLAGRTFDRFDGRGEGEPVVIVNETFVRTHLSHLDDPVGARIAPGTDDPDEDTEWWTVVGVTADVKHYGLDQEMRPGVYQPFAAYPTAGFAVALDIEGELGPIMSEARAITAAADVELPVYAVQTMSERIEQSLFTRRATSWLIALFSIVALLMAVAGLYGVISYSVGQRRQEISIRMAMGAESGRVTRDVLAQGMRLVVLGAALGLFAAVAGAGVVSRLLVGVSATDPAVYVGVTVLVLAVAAAANYLPARRAARLQPMRALRGE